MDRLEWLEGRKKGLGGSDIACICGLSKWNSPKDIWDSKLGNVPVTDEMTTAQLFGTLAESVVVKMFEMKTGLHVTTGCDQVADAERPYMLANVDGIIQSEGAIFEAKTASAFCASEWGAEDTEEIPIAYFLQVQHYMGVLNMNKTYVAVCIGGGQDFKHYTIQRDDKVIAMIRERSKTFWEDFVKKGIQPPLTVDEAVKDIVNVNKGATVVSNVNINQALLNIRELKSQKKVTDNSLKENENIVKAHLGENEILLDADGNTLATWKGSVSKRFDSKTFKTDCPDTYNDYVFESASRRFLIK